MFTRLRTESLIKLKSHLLDRQYRPVHALPITYTSEKESAGKQQQIFAAPWGSQRSSAC